MNKFKKLPREFEMVWDYCVQLVFTRENPDRDTVISGELWL